MKVYRILNLMTRWHGRQQMDNWSITTDEEDQDDHLEGVKELFDDDTTNRKDNIFVEKWRNFSARNCTALKQSNETGILFSLKTCVSIVVLVFFKFFWDAIDLTLDVYIFYRLERGEVLDDVIYRNIHVNNAIYAFAILGCLAKIGVWKLFSSNIEFISNNTIENFENDLNFSKDIIGVTSFLFEDGPELILEYFYIEKYITSYTPLIIVKDAMIACLLSYTAIRIFQSSRRQIKFSNRFGISFNIFVAGVTLASILRVGGALYQYITKKLRRSCFMMDNGRILQTPFHVGCMRGVDYAILILVSVSLCVPLLLLFTVILKKIIIYARVYARHWEFKHSQREEEIVDTIPENSTLV